MDMASFVEVNQCYFKVEVNLVVMNLQVSCEATFMFYICKDENLSDRLKISLVNVNNEEDSYTCLLNRSKFEAMKVAQDLVIDYGDLIGQLELLLEPPNDTCKLKLKIADSIKLIFYTTSQLKLLTLLEIPFLRTSTKEIANNFKTQIADLKKAVNTLEESVSEFQEENRKLQLRVADRDKIFELSESYQDKINEIVPRLNELERENNEMKQKLECTTIEKFAALVDLTTYRDINDKQAKEIEIYKKDVDAMKNGTNYYIAKTEDLKEMVSDLQAELRETVAAYKYDDLLLRFSHMAADLISKNVMLDEMEVLGRQQKLNNAVLHERLNACMETISTLQVDNGSSDSDLGVGEIEDDEIEIAVVDDEPLIIEPVDTVKDEGMPLDKQILPVADIANLIKDLEKKNAGS